MALTEEQFQQFLAALDADRAKAGERYELLRRRLLMFFAARRSPHSEECADEALDRTARRVAEGVAMEFSIESFILGVARNVLREEWRKPRATEFELSRVRAAMPEPEDGRAACLETCLQSLAPQSRRWVETFYRDSGSAGIRTRKLLADELGIDTNALRVRMHRIRARLEECVRECNDSRRGDT